MASLAPPVGIYPGSAREIPFGGQSIVAIYGGAQGGLVYNPATVADQGISFNPYTGAHSAPENLFYSFTGPAATSVGNGTFTLYPGEMIAFPPGCTSNLWVNAASNGHQFSAIVIQSLPAFSPYTGSFPPSGPTTLQNTIPSYLYKEYDDDPDLQAFVFSYNQVSQTYLDWFNTINLPIYTGLSAPLLDWVAEGLYGISRPTLYSYNFLTTGTFGKIEFGTYTYGTFDILEKITNVAVTSDDIFKRIITWHFYKGDGKNVNTRWMKKRTARFLYGANGTDYQQPTSNISIMYSPTGQLTITILSGLAQIKNSNIFGRCGFGRTWGTPTPPFGVVQAIVTQIQVPNAALQFCEGINNGVLETANTMTVTARIGVIGIPLT